ncbi:MAG: hypothetical protein Kow0059_04210 [Candidatus Sumerlaeia bacterium]
MAKSVMGFWHFIYTATEATVQYVAPASQHGGVRPAAGLDACGNGDRLIGTPSSSTGRRRRQYQGFSRPFPDTGFIPTDRSADG